MRDRRRRILLEVQKLLEEGSVDGFTMRDIGRRAGVAHRTLYNVFGSKEEIITAAIEDHFLDALAKAPRPTSPDLIEAALQHIDGRGHQVLELKPYAAAMVTIYFSPTLDRRIHDSLFRLSRIPWDRWIEQASEVGIIRRPLPTEREVMISFIANSAFATIGDLLAERLSPEQYILRGKIAFLTVIRTFAQKASLKAIQTRLAELYTDYERLPETSHAETAEAPADPRTGP